MKIFSLLATLSLLLRHAVAEDAVCRPALTDDPLCVVLLAGRHIDVGTVCLSVDDAGETMSVTYSTDDGWELDEVHLWVGDDLGDMPQTSGNRRRPGNPIPGQFPLAAEFDIPVTEYTFTIDVGGDSMLPDFSGFACPSDDESFAFAAHAAVSNPITNEEETAWGGDMNCIEGSRRWAYCGSFTLTCECEDPPTDPPGDGSCETAFALGEKCFDNWGFSRWGWVVGPLGYEEVRSEIPIYAGAGQCDTTKGTLVGELTIDLASKRVTYEITTAGWEMQEAHLHITNGEGPDSHPLPYNTNSNKYTVAPGKYNYAEAEAFAYPDSTTVYEFDISDSGVDFSKDVYVLAHAVVTNEDIDCAANPPEDTGADA